MKRNTILAIALASAATVATVAAVPVLAHGIGGRGSWQAGQQQMGGMMGDDHGNRDAWGGRGFRGGMRASQTDMMGPRGEGYGPQGGMMQMMMGPGGMGQGMGMGIGPAIGGLPGGSMMGGGMMRQLFDQFDTDGNGIVSADEARAGLAAQLEKYDANGDGVLSLGEFEALHADFLRETMVDRFQALDNDGDGQVTLDEITAPARMIERMQSLHDARDATRSGGADTAPVMGTAPDMMNDN